MKATTVWISILAVGALSAAGLALWNFVAPAPPPSAPFSALSEAPPFELADKEGRNHRLDSLRGQAVLVHFWATWCPPCIAEFPTWIALAKKYQGRNIKFVAISLDKTWADTEKLILPGSLPDNVISLLDPGSKVAGAYGAFLAPETFLLGRDGRIIIKWAGAQDWKSHKILDLLEKVSGD